MATKKQPEKLNIKQETRKAIPDEILFTPIDECGLSVRTANRLKSVGIGFISDLIQYNKHDLIKIHGLGAKGYYSVLYLLNKLGLGLDNKTLLYQSLQEIAKSEPSEYFTTDKLGMDIRLTNLSNRTVNLLLGTGIDTVGKLIKETKEKLYKIRGFGRRSMWDIEYLLEKMDLKLAETTKPKPDLSTMKIKDLRMPKRAKNLLIANGIYTVDKLAKTTKDELRKIHGLGFGSLNDIECTLEKMGFKLAETTKPTSLIQNGPKTLLDIKTLEAFAKELSSLMNCAKVGYDAAKKSSDESLREALKTSDMQLRKRYIKSADETANFADRELKKRDSLSKRLNQANELIKRFYSVKQPTEETNKAIAEFLSTAKLSKK